MKKIYSTYESNSSLEKNKHSNDQYIGAPGGDDELKFDDTVIMVGYDPTDPDLNTTVSSRWHSNHTNVVANNQLNEAIEPDNSDMINHPKHYGGKDNPYEVIKIIEHFNLNFKLGNVIKYILRDKWDNLEDLKKAQWYLNKEINQRMDKLSKQSNI